MGREKLKTLTAKISGKKGQMQLLLLNIKRLEAILVVEIKKLDSTKKGLPPKTPADEIERDIRGRRKKHSFSFCIFLVFHLGYH